MCVLFVIILVLLQFRVIQDSYLLSLCYGILFAATILCVMSMPALNKIIPIDTKEVGEFASFIYTHKINTKTKKNKENHHHQCRALVYILSPH